MLKKGIRRKPRALTIVTFSSLERLLLHHFLTTTRSKVFTAKPTQHTILSALQTKKKAPWLHASNFILCKLGNIVKAKRKVTLHIFVARFQHFFHKKWGRHVDDGTLEKKRQD